MGSIKLYGIIIFIGSMEFLDWERASGMLIDFAKEDYHFSE